MLEEVIGQDVVQSRTFQGVSTEQTGDETTCYHRQAGWHEILVARNPVVGLFEG